MEKSFIGKYCIVRADKAGVFAGTLISREGQEAILKDARRIWYWDGAASLSQLATDGTSKPDNCKFPCEVKIVLLTGVGEIIPCTAKARKSIKEVKVWEE
jgi:hypothetical protein